MDQILALGTSYSDFKISKSLTKGITESLFKSRISALPKKKGRGQVREPREKNHLKLD